MCEVREIVKNRILDLCKEKHLTPYSLANRSSVPLSTMFHLLDGTTRNPGVVTILKLCNGLEITLEEFFNTVEFEELLEVVNEEE